MVRRNNYTYITDLGLCQPENVKFFLNRNEKVQYIYVVLSNIAPEVLRGKEYILKQVIFMDMDLELLHMKFVQVFLHIMI